MRIIESRSIDNQAGLLGSRLITGTSTIEGAFQSFIVAEDTIVSKVYNSIGIDVTQKLGLTSVTLKAGAFISMAKGDCFSSIKLTSGSVVAYFVSHGGMTITADAYMNEFLARVGSSYLEAAECAKATLQGLINIGLLQKASLIMSPSMYQEDLVKSVVPQDGSGDLTFTRASNGTRINSAGLVEVCPWNMVEQSETLTNAIWNLYAGSSVTSNSQTAPNGTLTADTLNSTTGQYSGIYQPVGTLPTNVYTYSMYAKAGTNSFFYMIAQGSGSQIAFFNLSTGVVTSTLNLDSASIESVGNGWYRCQIQKTGAGLEIFVGSSNIANTNATASGTVFLWGAQLNIGSTAKPYFPTTDRLNVPRLTYQNGGGGCPSLLLEKQSTNLITYSEQFDSANWIKNDTTVSANTTTSPDGNITADSLIENTSNGLHIVYQAVGIAGTYTLSFYVKANTRNWVYITMYDGIADRGAYFNVSTGVVGNIDSGVTASIQSVGNGWYRCIVTATNLAVFSSSCQLATADGTRSYTGDGTSGLFIWGAQLEASSYPTSYIPTTTASATRVADVAQKTGISSLIGQTEGTIFLDIETIAENSDWFTISPVSGSPYSNGIGIGYYSNSVRLQLYSSTNAIFATLSSITGRNKIAVAYKSGDTAIYINGTSVFTSATTFVFGVNLDGIKLLSDSWVAGAMQKAQANEALLFKTRLTNSELASLTTI
jgi:hypothetical protein